MRLCGAHRRDQRADADDVEDAFEIVGQHVQGHLGGPATMAKRALGEESVPDLTRYITIPPAHLLDLAIEHHFQPPFSTLWTHTANGARTC